MKSKVLFLIVCVCFSVAAYSNQSLNKNEYQRLNEALDLMAAEHWDQAKEVLLEASHRRYSKLARGIAFYNLGQIELRADNHQSALIFLQQAHALNSLNEQQQIQTLYSIGQLQCILAQWQTCVENLLEWQQYSVDIAPADYHLVAYAYSQLQQWPQLLNQITLALDLHPDTPAEWLQLKIIAHIKLQQWDAAIRQGRLQVAQESQQDSYWRQLIGLQIQQKRYAEALACQRLALERKVLNKPDDFIDLASMFEYAGVPLYAARSIEQGFSGTYLKRNERNLSRLLGYYLQAKEYRQAVPILIALQSESYEVKRALMLSQIQSQLQRWADAETTLSEVLTKKSGDTDRLTYLLAQSQIHQGKLDQARANLLAIKHPNYTQAAGHWLQHIDLVQP